MENSIYIAIPIDGIEEETEKPSKTYRLDLDAGRIAGYVDGQRAVEQAIRKALLTPRFKCLIYDNQYGSEIEETVTVKDASQEYARTAIKGFIKDALDPDTRILAAYDYVIDFSGDGCYIAFTAETIFGPVRIEEEL